MQTIDLLESNRIKSQALLDSGRSREERNRCGQFATPAVLAADMLEYAKTQLPIQAKVRFLDPAFGTGSFFSALLRIFPKNRIFSALGYEIDPAYGDEALVLWEKTKLRLVVADFTKTTPPEREDAKANLVICNPPYVRHHHLSAEEKLRLGEACSRSAGAGLGGLAGLYCYFLCISHSWMARNALAGWLIPSEFMDVNYGRAVKNYLLSRVTLLRIHCFDPGDLQFADAMVSSAIVWFRNAPPTGDHLVDFTYGGTLNKPDRTISLPVRSLNPMSKWSRLSRGAYSSTPQEDRLRLGDLFTIKRGIATGANSYFILTPEQISLHRLPGEILTPILPSPRYITDDEIPADKDGLPDIAAKLFLFDCRLEESEIKRRYPSVHKYLERGVSCGLHERYLCRHRDPWYNQEVRVPCAFLCTYMGRRNCRKGRPFRFILNRSQAIAPNVYLMLYPKARLADALKKNPQFHSTVWKSLSAISQDILIGEGRTYGGGLHKMEPGELANTPADEIFKAVPDLAKPGRQMSLFNI